MAKIKSSGNKFVDWFFGRMVDLLNKKSLKIFLKNSLQSPYNKQQSVWGWTQHERRGHNLSLKWAIIFINAGRKGRSARHEMAKTLTHELLHILMVDAWERQVERGESSLWESFSHDQRRKIKSYIPKHRVLKKKLMGIER